MAVLFALALIDPQQHALAVDIAHLQARDLGHPQARAVRQPECRLVLRPRRRFEQPHDLVRREPLGSLRGWRTSVRWRTTSGRPSVILKKNRSAATAPFMVGGVIPVSR